MSTFGNNTPDASRNLTVPGGTAGADAQLDPAITNIGGIGAGERGVRLQNSTSGQGRANRQQLTVTFRTTSINGHVVNTTGLNFYITDIDAITTSPYADRVELTGSYNQSRDGNIRGAGLNVAESATTRRPVAHQRHQHQPGRERDGARVQVTYTGDTSAFTLAYWNASSPAPSTTGSSSATSSSPRRGADAVRPADRPNGRSPLVRPDHADLTV